MTAPIASTNSKPRGRLLRRPPHAIRPASPRPQRRDCQGRLVAALQAIGGPDCDVACASLRPWCSATFVGAQHGIRLRLTGADARHRLDVVLADLSDVDMPLPHHIVVDVMVESIDLEDPNVVTLNLAILTIEDW